MSSQYINPIPTFEAPTEFLRQKYIYSRLAIKQIEKAIRWCKKEYWDALNYFSSHGDMNNFRFLNEEFSPFRFLATTGLFEQIVEFIRLNPYIWDNISREDRKFITTSLEFYQLMRQ